MYHATADPFEPLPYEHLQSQSALLTVTERRGPPPINGSDSSVAGREPVVGGMSPIFETVAQFSLERKRLRR